MKTISLAAIFFSLGLVTGCNPLVGGAQTSSVDPGFNPGLPAAPIETVDTAPVAKDLAITTNKNVASSSHLPVIASANTSLTFSILTAPTQGAVTLTDAATGAFTYTPATGQFGTDSFTFAVSNDAGTSQFATVSITINDTFSAPVATAITPPAFAEDTQSGLVVLAYTDADGDKATSCTVSNLNHVSVSQACACDVAGVCSVKLTGSTNYNGAASFDYVVTAAAQTSNTAAANLTITPINDSPTMAVIAAASTNEDVAKAVAFTVADIDSTLTCTTTHLSMTSSDPAVVANASVSWTGTYPNCTGTVTPVADAYGSTTLTFIVTDGMLTASRAFVLTVNRLADDSITAAWPFNSAGASTAYTYASALIDFGSGYVKLKAADQTDSSLFGFTASDGAGLDSGTCFDGSVIRLTTTGDSVTACNHAPNTNVELDATWTPAWTDIVGYWKLNEFAGAGSVVDSSPVGTNLGTPTGGVTTGVGAKIANGAAFDGSSGYIDFGAATSLKPTAKISIATWVKFSSVAAGGGGFTRILSDWHQATNTDRWLFYISSNGVLTFTVSNVNESSAPVVSAPIVTGVWYHVVGTYDGSQIAIYLNGNQINTAPLTGLMNSTSPSVRMGKQAETGDYFNGTFDETAIWKTSLTASAVATLYRHQSSKYLGAFTSRAIDSMSASQAWKTFNWAPSLPLYKNLPDAGVSESNSASNYSELANSTLMSDISGLWHLDEAASASAALDKSGIAIPNNATATAVTFGGRGRLGGGADFGVGGATSCLNAGNTTATQLTSGTVSAWLKTTNAGSSYRTVVAKQDAYGLFLQANTLVVYDWTTTQTHTTGVNLADGNWHQVAFVFRSGVTNGSHVYIDGVSTLTFTYTVLDQNTFFGIGCNAAPMQEFNGSLDEIALWSRPLAADEISQLYRRGANRAFFQVRTCSEATCTTGSPTWLGPDGTNQSYFSEIYNTGANVEGASGTANAPTMTFANFGVPLTTNLSSNRFFQYRAVLESDDTSSPELNAVSVGPNHYSKASPTVVNQVGFEFFSLATFAENTTVGETPSCPAGAKYQLALSAAGPWKYYDTTFNSGVGSWVAGGSTDATANDAATLTAGRMAQFSSQIGAGDLYFRAFLPSDGEQPCELGNVEFGTSR